MKDEHVRWLRPNVVDGVLRWPPCEEREEEGKECLLAAKIDWRGKMSAGDTQQRWPSRRFAVNHSDEDPQFTILKLRDQVRTMTESRDRAWREYQHRKPLDGRHWLIEVGTPASYYCGPGDWCSNPNHALQFVCREDAAAVACRFGKLSGGHPRPVEHGWISSQSDGSGDAK